MKRKDILNIRKQDEKVRFFDGVFRHYTKCIGYCNSKSHKGFITISMLKEHQCLQKKCYYFDPVEDHPQWIYRMDKKANKALIKERKSIEKLIVEKAKEFFSEYIEVVMCKHLYDSTYLLVIVESDFSIFVPDIYWEELGIDVYIKAIFEYQKENIEYTYKNLLPDDMKNKIK